MSHYPYQPNARFSGGSNRRSENDSASPRRTKEENTRSRAPRLTNRVPPPVATPAYLVEQVCMIDKDLSNVPDKISANADVIQNGRNPRYNAYSKTPSSGPPAASARPQRWTRSLQPQIGNTTPSASSPQEKRPSQGTSRQPQPTSK